MICMENELKKQVQELLFGLVDENNIVDNEKLEQDIYEFILYNIKYECLTIADKIAEKNNIIIK